MANLKTDLLDLCRKLGEPIEAIVVGRDDEHRWDQDESPTKEFEGRLIPVEMALSLLDKEYDNGFGGADCRPFKAWTKSWVIWVHEYDGSTNVVCTYRNPTAFMPSFG